MPGIYCSLSLPDLDPSLVDLRRWIGLDTITLNLLLPLKEGSYVRGYLYAGPGGGADTQPTDIAPYAPKRLTAFQWLLTKLGVVVATCFLFFSTTSVISFTLRATQARMLGFVRTIEARTRTGQPILYPVALHVLASLSFVPLTVGVLFFLLSVFGSQAMAVTVLTVVWVGEVYTAVCLRSREGLNFWPKVRDWNHPLSEAPTSRARGAKDYPKSVHEHTLIRALSGQNPPREKQVFFLYWTMFHVYFLGSPQGFTGLALGCACAFLAHSMIFFWGRYEVAAVVVGDVWEGRKRAVWIGGMGGGRGRGNSATGRAGVGRRVTEEWVEEEVRRYKEQRNTAISNRAINPINPIYLTSLVAGRCWARSLTSPLSSRWPIRR